jgi:hypothetical protein
VCALPLFLFNGCADTLHRHTRDIPYAGLDVTTHDTPVLTLRGTHYERGYGHGSLLASAIMDVFSDAYITRFMDADSGLYESARRWAHAHLVFDSCYVQEARGMYMGMQQTGISLYDTTLQRSIDWFDLLMLSCVEELYTKTGKTMGCSSISSWGDATAHDSLLQGDVIITRHWDYTRLPSLIQNLILIVHIPAEDDKQPWLSACWAGMIGSCSAVNSDGMGAFLNYGPLDTNQATHTNIHRPLSLSLRTAVASCDYNGDGISSAGDVETAIRDYRPYFGAIVHVTNPPDNTPPSLVIECSNTDGVVTRTKDHNTRIPGSHLVATNHFRLLHAPRPCDRYAAIADSLDHSTHMTRSRSWSMMADAAAYPGCLYSMSYIPSRALLSYARTRLHDARPAYAHPGDDLDLDSMFAAGRTLRAAH